MSIALAPFVRQRTVALTTYRRDGTPVSTAVSIAVDGDRGRMAGCTSATLPRPESLA